jgi:tetratricopeptide (TPR) repeat protein
MIAKLLAGMLYSQARWFLGLGRLGWGHGSRLLRWACRLWPRHPEAGDWLRFVQGKEALRRGQPDRALPLLLAAERALPRELGVRADIGLAQTMAGNFEQAIVVLERAAKEEEAAQREDVWSSLAWSYLKTGRAPKAREACLRAEQVEVQSPRLALLYRLATGVGLGALPVAEVSELLVRLPEAAAMVMEFARQQAQEGRYRLARAAVTALPEAEQPHAFHAIGHASLNEDDADTAAWAAEQMVSSADQSLAAAAALLQSEVGIRRGDFAEALRQAQQAQAADAGQSRAHEQVGRALLLAGEWEQAVDAMIEALHRGHAGPLAAGVAALAAMEVNDLQSARGVFLAQRSGDGLACATSHTAQARLLTSEGSFPEALQLSEWALEELAALPAWAAQPGVMQRFARVLREALQIIRDSGEAERRAEAEALLQRLAELPGGGAE